MSRSLTAIANLRRSKTAFKGGGMVRKEVSQVFKRKRQVQTAFTTTTMRPAKHIAWKHQFVCLAFYLQKKLPTTKIEMDELFEAGLGRKDVEFSSLDLDPKAFREVMFEAFPKLHHGGGYRFCKCKPN